MEETAIINKKKIRCPDCREEMYRLPGSLKSTYVCPKCGCSIDIDDQNFDFEDASPNSNHRSDSENDNGLSIDKLFDNTFMKKYTKYDNFTDFILDSKLIPEDISVITYEIFQSVPKERLDEYIQINTVFHSWDDMFDKATSRYLRF